MDYQNKARKMIFDYYTTIEDNDLLNDENSDKILLIAKMCASIAVNSILNNSGVAKLNETQEKYWQDVKDEIQKINMPDLGHISN